jgi:cytochrome c-type biogenesis protein CcmH/NrfG
LEGRVGVKLLVLVLVLLVLLLLLLLVLLSWPALQTHRQTDRLQHTPVDVE